ncbi:MAG: ATP synthase F1 subunit gamma [Saccharofermentanales bacterium]
MEQIYDIKKRMRSINEIKQMTHAMHLISAVKMKRARSQLRKTLPFFDLCRATMAEIYIQSPQINHSFFIQHKKKKGEPQNIGYFILTGDQGLAGAYNINVVNTAQNLIHANMIDLAKKGVKAVPKLFIAGKTGKAQFKKLGFEIVEDFIYPIEAPTFYRAREISEYIHDLYDDYKIDSVYMVYTHIKSAIDIKPVVTKVIPISSEDLLEGVDLDVYKMYMPDPSTINIEFVPSSDEVMDYLARTYLNGMVYGALTEAYASEQTTRMTAMKNATDNAEEMEGKLTLLSNRARQGKITQDITEVVSGAESLKNHG